MLLQVQILSLSPGSTVVNTRVYIDPGQQATIDLANGFGGDAMFLNTQYQSTVVLNAVTFSSSTQVAAIVSNSAEGVYLDLAGYQIT